MKPLNIGVLSQIPNLLKELKIRVPSGFTVTNLQSDSSSKSSASSTDNAFKGIDLIVADYDLVGPHLYDLENVKFVHGTWAGVDALLPHIKPDVTLNVPIFRFSGAHFGRIISEYVITCIVNHERDFFKVNQNQTIKLWSHEGKILTYRTIYDMTIGVMGVGQIGSRLMQSLKFMGANIRALGRRTSINKNEFPYIDEYFSTCNLSEFLKNCDYVVNTLPNTDETRGVLNGSILEVCKEKSPIFINVGRGGVIADESLLKAFENNWLSHAYLDVFNQEPLPEEHPFWSSLKVKITPHVAATSRPQDIAEQFMENLNLFLKNENIPSRLDFSRGY